MSTAHGAFRRVLVTGGAGFIGSNFTRYLLETYPDCQVTVLDKLTYAGNLANLKGLDERRLRFVRGDICDREAVEEAARGCDAIVNFAAESHVDRSLMDAYGFVLTDVLGPCVLLDASLRLGIERFLQVSTDEVYGAVLEGSSREYDRLEPRSPYSASKAGGEFMVRAYAASHGVRAIITRASNNIGPYQYPEKAAPLFITNAIDDQPLPIYGDGRAVRDYLYVRDHCAAIDLLLRRGEPGGCYNVGAGNEVDTIMLSTGILDLLGKPRSLMRFVADRPGHDRRYSVDSRRLRALGWAPAESFATALEKTVRWYVDNQWWWRPIRSGEYQDYYRRQYAERLTQSRAVAPAVESV